MVELAGAGLARSVTNGICSSSSRANPRWVVSLESKTRCGGSVPCVCFQKSIEAKDLVGLLALPIALGSRQSPGTSRTRLPSLPRWARRRSRSPTCPGWRSGCAASAPFWPTIGAHCSAYCTTHPEHAPAARRVWARAFGAPLPPSPPGPDAMVLRAHLRLRRDCEVTSAAALAPAVRAQLQRHFERFAAPSLEALYRRWRSALATCPPRFGSFPATPRYAGVFRGPAPRGRRRSGPP